jgi:hypothetical protein
VQAARSRRLDIRLHAQRLERVADDQSALAYQLERRALAWVEIEMHIVRPVVVVASRVPLIEIDASEVDDPQQRREIIDHRKVDDLLVAVRDRAGANPRRPRLGASFMKNCSPAAPFGYRRITMARSRMCGSSTGATSA